MGKMSKTKRKQRPKGGQTWTRAQRVRYSRIRKKTELKLIEEDLERYGIRLH